MLCFLTTFSQSLYFNCQKKMIIAPLIIRMDYGT